MKISKLIFAIGLSLALCACDNSSKDNITSVSSGTYILNNGNWGSNDSNIGVYNPSTRKFTADAFKMVKENGKLIDAHFKKDCNMKIFADGTKFKCKVGYLQITENLPTIS